MEESNLDKNNPVVRLRVFRAIDDPKTCLLFIKGHEHVLTNIGVEKVTSSKDEWMFNPAAFVLTVESLDGEKVYGGARVHVAGGSEPLPIEQATTKMDLKVHALVRQYAARGTGEICGLWNSREIAGYGIGSIFLTRAAVAISSQIRLSSLFALCAPYTVKMAELVGYNIDVSIGNNGTFYYPKLDLLATAMILQDVDTLNSADDENRNAIFALRENLNLIRVENLRRKEIEIHYELEVFNLQNWDLDYFIEKAMEPYSLQSNLTDLNIL